MSRLYRQSKLEELSGRIIDLDQLELFAGSRVDSIFHPFQEDRAVFSKTGKNKVMKNLKILLLSAIIALLVVAIGLGFLFGVDNPVPWILIGVLILIPILYRWKARADELVWKDTYSVGVKVLDDDHKKLIELANKFQTAYKYHTGEEFERQALTDLVDYTKYHFQREEDLMEEQGYPGLEAHKDQHRSMIAEVERFMKDYEARGHEALEGVANYLMGWLINHINGTDQQYGSFLNEKGIT
jgi:hemerythrin-like metal-binding protein